MNTDSRVRPQPMKQPDSGPSALISVARTSEQRQSQCRGLRQGMALS